MSKTQAWLVLCAYSQRGKQRIPVLPERTAEKGHGKADTEQKPVKPRKVFVEIAYLLRICCLLACTDRKVGSLAGFFKKAFAAGLLATVLLFISSRNGYAVESIDSLTQFLDTLSYEYKGFDIKLKNLSMGETYDDNITYAKEDKLEDFITTLGVGMSAIYEGKTKTVELTANIGHQTFAKNGDFSNDTQGMTVNFMNELSKYDRMSLTNTFTHTDAPVFFRSDIFQEQSTTTTGKFDIFKNKFHADYSRDVSKHMNITVKYDNDTDIFAGVDLPNSFFNRIGVESNYTFTQNTVFLSAYDFSNRLFENEGNASIHTITPGLRQYITRKIYFDGKAGLSYIDSFDDESLIRPVLDTALSYEINKRTLAKISFVEKRDTNPYTVDILDYWRTTVAVTQQVTERFKCSQSVFYGSGEYISFDSTYELLGANTLITYDINKNLKGNLSYTFSDVDSNIDTNGYLKNTVFLGLTAEF